MDIGAAGVGPQQPPTIRSRDRCSPPFRIGVTMFRGTTNTCSTARRRTSFFYSNTSVYLVQGFYVVSYGLGIYILNLLIGFLSPQVDPEIHNLSYSDDPSLPTCGSDEFPPLRPPPSRFQVLVISPSHCVKLSPLRLIRDCPVCVCRNAFKFCESVSGRLSLELMGGWVGGWMGGIEDGGGRVWWVGAEERMEGYGRKGRR
ncbi:hypothetical protein ACFX11_028741 [Malus domestica]